MSERIDPNTIGEKRAVSSLGRGDHVQLADGRWALLLGKPTESLTTGMLSASVSIEMKHTEGASWRKFADVFSRTPAEQIRYVEARFAELRPAPAGAR